MTPPLVGVLALQGDVREHTAALQACGAHVRAVRRPADLEGIDGLVLPGGESTTIDKLSRTSGIRDHLVSAIADGLPAYGSCAGLILLADHVVDRSGEQQSFGGLDISVRRNAFGRQVESFETDLHLTGIDGGPMHAVFIRAPWIEAVGDDVQVVAAVIPPGTDTLRPVAVRQGCLLATAFHPEVTTDLRIHRHFLELTRGRT